MSQSPATIAAFRFGYGFALGMPVAADPEQLLAQVQGGDDMVARYAGPPLPERGALDLAYSELRRARRDAGEAFDRKEEFAAVRRDRRLLRARDVRNVFFRALFSPHSFRERLCQFWLDHFALAPKSRYERTIWGHYVEQAIRPHVGGAFADLLISATLHPSMLLFLDQAASVGPNSEVGKKKRVGLNENLAREVLELHTLGVGGPYDQSDVRELAELLTGLSVDRKSGMVFDPRKAEPGREKVLGRRYGGWVREARLKDVTAFLNDVARHPQTARHIAGKLARHFIDDTPDPGIVESMETAFIETGGDLLAVYAAMLRHPAAWAPLGGKAKQPFDFIVSGMRALGASADQLEEAAPRHAAKLLEQPMAAMGQPMLRVPGPDGWPEEAEAWINPQGIAARLQWSLRMAKRRARERDPRAFVDFALRDLAGDSLRRAVAGAEDRIEGIALVLSSPEFNRR